MNENESKHTDKGRDRVLRLLTLACFFHFSGLNNGLTTMAVISQTADTTTILSQASFAGLMAQKTGALLNPAHWSLFTFRSKWLNLLVLFKQAGIQSSENILQEVLVQSNLASHTLIKTFQKTIGDSTLGKHSSKFAQKNTNSIASPALIRQLSENEKAVEVVDSPLTDEYGEEAWYEREQRALLKERGKSGKKFFHGLKNGNQSHGLENITDKVRINARLGKLSWNHFPPRMNFSSSGKEEDDLKHTNLENAGSVINRSTLRMNQGAFVLRKFKKNYSEVA